MPINFSKYMKRNNDDEQKSKHSILVYELKK